KKISLTQILDFWHYIAKFSDNPALGFRAGQCCHLLDYGVFAHLLMNCPSINASLRLISDYLYMLNESLASVLITDNNITSYVLDCAENHVACFHHIEFHFASLVQFWRQIVTRKANKKIVPYRVEFTHSAPLSVQEYEIFFGCKVLFEQKQNRIILPDELLALPTHAPNKWLYQYLLKRVDSIHKAEVNNKKFISKVYHAFALEEGSQGWPTLDKIASNIGMSSSSLKRKLKLENSSYQTICDHLRYKQAKRMLSTQGQTVSVTAVELGFSSSAAFSRSFKRWSEQSPTDYLMSLVTE
ncbi:MAG: AraC family transcriptional regulator, partial [Alteromonadaceae bacterium]|nr:AraC family transcriptional regulator [Alteromonadaceae bacterium]